MTTRSVEKSALGLGEQPAAIDQLLAVARAGLDPTSSSRLPFATDPDRQIIVVCNEGYSSSLAAATLQLSAVSRD